MTILLAYRYDITAGTIIFCLFTALVLIAAALDAIREVEARCEVKKEQK